MSEELAQVLLLDTEAYLASLLFKPQTLTVRCQQDGSEGDGDDESQHESAGPAAPVVPTPSSYKHLSPYSHPYSSLSPAIAPSSSRAWVTAAYLYLHIVLEFIWNPHAPVDPQLLRWLLDSLQVDITRTEEAMRIGAYSGELWLWKVVVGRLRADRRGASVPRWRTPGAIDPSLRGRTARRPGGAEEVNDMIRLRRWFDEKDPELDASCQDHRVSAVCPRLPERAGPVGRWDSLSEISGADRTQRKRWNAAKGVLGQNCVAADLQGGESGGEDVGKRRFERSGGSVISRSSLTTQSFGRQSFGSPSPVGKEVRHHWL